MLNNTADEASIYIAFMIDNSNVLIFFVELTSTETIKIEPKVVGKRKFTETLSDTSFFILNEMINVVNNMTTESEISELYELIEVFIQNNKEEIENEKLEDLLTKLREKITVYANMQEENQMQILARFFRFNIMLKKYEARMDYSKSSILLLVTFSSRLGYDLYKKDLENGRIGEQILEVFLYPPFLESFGLKADDIEISLNGRLLTQPKGKEDVKHVVKLIFFTQCTMYMYSVFVHKKSYISIIYSIAWMAMAQRLKLSSRIRWVFESQPRQT